MKVALVHYWLVGMRGGERVLEALCEMYPDADVFTHVYDPEAVSPAIRRHNVRTTFIDRLPRARTAYQKYLPLMPLALEQLDLTDYDLVISSESGPAKGVLRAPGSLHVCYCHSPMRYLWDQYHIYRARAGAVTRLVMPPLTHYLRMWDHAAAARVDHFVANSRHVQGRIRAFWGRSSQVIAPPVDVGRFTLSRSADDFYLMLGQLVPYKRPELAIEAFNRSGRRLVVIGGGEMLSALRRAAAPNVELRGFVDEAGVSEAYARCRALVFPGEEDFGIVPVEAMASGKPVIAYGRGGALDTVIDGETGVLFAEQSAEAIERAVARFEAMESSFDPDRLRAHALRFDRPVFEERFRRAVDDARRATLS